MAEQKKTLETDPNKKKALELALAQIEKQFGKGSIMKLDGSVPKGIEAIPTGSLALDIALGIGGVPKGRVIEIFGPESSGKTTLTLSLINQLQKTGGTAAFIDAEHAFDAAYAQKIGVKLEDLLISQPDTGEQALEITETLVRSNAVDLIIIDSVAALTPRAEIEGDMGDSHMGLQARLMSQALRKLTAIISKSKTCVIFINQIRMKIGVMFGSPETTTGGRALKFYSSVRIDLRRVESMKQGEVIIGNKVKAKIVKNKVAAPFKEAFFEIHFNEGISKEADIIDLAVNNDIILKAGAWFSYEGEKIGQGKENSRQFLKDNPKILAKIEKEILKKFDLA
ncbi:MAG: recombinase RecA [Candidatus Omnitrophica bacterium]|nr:recombinase RecA [Candidatus Omnitrophota bacterium]MBU1995688.1 recombinase RecA [Candidatus Omnitrophota bacterium]MBU4333019.1 recombinase RecA [Candidatus Omnitrophota bacterium]